MSLGITSADYTGILNDLSSSVTYKEYNGSLDEFGGTTYSYASNVSKTWVFFKRGSKTNLAQYGIIEDGDAYIIVPTTDSISYRDRVIFDSETYEYTPQCMTANRYANGVNLYKYYTLKRIG